MIYRRFIPVAVAGLLVACSQDATGPAPDEMTLAIQAERIAQDVAATTGTTHERWLWRLFQALRDSDDPEAQSCLAEARELREQARAAAAAGRREAARELYHQSFLKVLCAVVEVFPNAPARTGAAVDQVVARIESFLGDREAPRIRRILAHVEELRNQANALIATDPVGALALNLRAIQILHRLAGHLRAIHDAVHDHDAIADAVMDAVPI
jgi:hypothetical protein